MDTPNGDGARRLPKTIELERRAPEPRFALSDDLELDDLSEARFATAVIDAGIRHVACARWSTEAKELGTLLELAVHTSRGRGTASCALRLDDLVGGPCWAYAYLCDGVAFVRVAANELEHLGAAEAWLRRSLPPSQPTDDQRVPVSFWSWGHGACVLSRTLDVPTWEQIEHNYPSPVRSALRELTRHEFRPGAGGQLLLWHGPPGTGKTHAIRALAWEWREWCRLHYVTDPEAFFGQASYLLRVLLREADDDDGDDDEEERWRLLVLEDTGELLTADAKERAGQGLSRLLNVVDGIVGQGLRVLLLVTTNEPLRALHPAVARPGRCLSQLEFPPFSREEAAQWLRRAGADVGDEAAEATLAGLYARLRGEQPPRRRRVGF